MKNNGFKQIDILIVLGLIGLLFVVLLLMVGLVLGISPVHNSVRTDPVTSVDLDGSNDQAVTMFDNENVWKITSANGEIVSDFATTLLYATKDGVTVTVMARDIQTGGERVILTYDEAREAEQSGNLWAGLPPSVSLSPDKQSIAYASRDGLFVYDLEHETTKVLIERLTEPEPGSEQPPEWSYLSQGTYILARPLWSISGNYLSFQKSHWEGSSFGFFDLVQDRYFDLAVAEDETFAGGYKNVVWSPAEDVLAKASGGGYEGIGLFVSQDNLEAVVDVTDGTGLSRSLIDTVKISGAGSSLVFTYQDNYDSPQSVATINTDGTDFAVLDIPDYHPGTWYAEPFFSANDAEVLYYHTIDDEIFLVAYDLATGESVVVAQLPPDYNRWTHAQWYDDTHLMLEGIRGRSNLVVAGESQLFVFDMQNHTVVYASPIFNTFTTYLGFLD